MASKINSEPDIKDTARGSFPLGSILLVVGVFFVTFVGRTILSPLLLPVERELGLSHAEGGSLFLIISIGFMLSMFFSGFLLERITYGTAITATAGISAVGLFLLATCKGIGCFRIGLFIMGFASGLYLPSGIVTITELAPVERRGMAISIHELGPIFGLAAGPFLAEAAIRAGNWRALMLVLAILALCMGVVFFRYSRGGRFHGTSPRFKELWTMMKMRDFWIISFFFIMAIGNEMGIYSMLPAFLVAGRGLDQTLVNSIVSTSRLTSLVMIFAAGWMADRFGFRWVIALISVACGTFTVLIGVSGGWLLITALYVQPMLVSAFFPAGFIALAGMSGRKQRNLSISLIFPMAYLLGGGMVPAVIGYFAERGSFGLGFVLTGCVMAAGVALIPFIKLKT